MSEQSNQESWDRGYRFAEKQYKNKLDNVMAALKGFEEWYKKESTLEKNPVKYEVARAIMEALDGVRELDR